MAKREKVRKKTLGKSSRDWVDRQLRDPYVRRAQEAGYRARAAYKLLEIDEKFHVLKRGARIIDLGCAPGGWLQVAAREGRREDRRRRSACPSIRLARRRSSVATSRRKGMDGKLIAALGDKPTLVLSDMAADTTGHKQTDHIRTVGLAEIGARFAVDNLVKGGTFVAKVFQGGAQGELLEMLKENFADPCATGSRRPAGRKVPRLLLSRPASRGAEFLPEMG